VQATLTAVLASSTRRSGLEMKKVNDFDGHIIIIIIIKFKVLASNTGLLQAINTRKYKDKPKKNNSLTRIMQSKYTLQRNNPPIKNIKKLTYAGSCSDTTLHYCLQ
jgi:hypothetical protein